MGKERSSKKCSFWFVWLCAILGPLLLLWLSTIWHYPFWWWWMPGNRRLCEELPSNSERPELVCFYVIRNRLVPFRIEILNQNPYVAKIHGLLPDGGRRDALNEYMLDFGELPSPALGFFHTELEEKILRGLNLRHANMTDIEKNTMPSARSTFDMVDLITGLSTDSLDHGVLALQTYLPPGHVVPHFDAYPNSYNPETGVMIATTIVYLAQPSKGGGTIFPLLGIGDLPAVGDALTWFNVNQKEERDWLVMHAGCPVFQGRKTVASFWFRSYGQEFRKPCTKNGQHFVMF